MAASVRLYGEPAGTLEVSRDGRLSFRYLPGWIEACATSGSPRRHALSASMPVQEGTFPHDVAGPWFDGLLPDNTRVRATLARHFQVDASDDYGLLTSLGRECPGAVAIVDEAEPAVPEEIVEPHYELLDEARLARHIRELPRRPLFVDADGELRLSLPGVHDKAAVLRVGDRVALPQGGTPTSHILKVDIQGLDDSIRLENFCLRIAGELGMDVPASRIEVAEDIHYMLIARYDRTLVTGPGGRFIRRIHQEDFCQALGRFPREKYEKDGGPGWREAFGLMNLTGDPLAARLELLDRALFQYLCGNPDAHAKNYSLVYRGGTLHLSKLYDVNNAAAFRAHYKEQRPRLAMLVGGERDPERLEVSHWRAFATEIGFSPPFVLDRLADMARRLPGAAEAARAKLAGTPGDSPIFALALEDMASRCAKVLGGRHTAGPKP